MQGNHIELFMNRKHHRGNRRRWLCMAGLCLLMSGCLQQVRMRGTVLDISGEALPGVVVRVAGTDYESLSNALGQYSLRAGSGELQLDFLKTGYTPARLNITARSAGTMQVVTLHLWPLPIGEGVYLFQDYRYSQTEHPRVNRYQVQDYGPAFGTPVSPGLHIRHVAPEINPDLNPPLMIAHKLPAYDARMHKMRQVKAAPVQSALGQRSAKAPQYIEDIWIADEAIPLICRPIDEPERLLIELRATRPLAPGAYAIHWGALEGYDSIDGRVFLFAVVEEAEDAGEEGEPEGELNADEASRDS